MIPFHPLADLFPLIEGEEFEALVADLRDNGLREKILLRGGQILDGRNRYRALLAAGLVGPRLNAAQAMEKHRRFFTSCDDLSERGAVARVVSLNLRRRHLNESQRALIAAKLATLGRGRRKGAAGKASIESFAPTERDAAALLNVSRASVQRAKALVEVAPPAALADVAAGRVRVSAALEQTRAALAEAGGAAGPVDVDKVYAIVKARREQERRDRAEAKKVARAAREQALGARIAGGNAELAALGAARKFGVILADPEWSFEVWGEGGKDRSAENHYPCSPTEAIAARPVAEIAADDAVLFLWATAPRLPDALAVMTAWGFAYRSHCVWLKPAPGTGYWFRSQHELLLVGTRGAVPAPAPGAQWRSTIEAPLGRHSEKPAFAHEMIEALFPTLPRIELNARAAREGWDVWGCEAPHAIAGRASSGGDGAAENQLPVAQAWCFTTTEKGLT